MEATCLFSSVLPPLPFSLGKPGCKKMRFLQGKRSSAMVFAAGRDHRGNLVDKSMIILRKRMHEMKMIERNYEPPEEWTEWEKRYYTCYDEYICQVVGLLQSYLMNTRPSFSLGMLALITMSIPASTVMIVLRLMEGANGVLSAVHHIHG
ncbi:hypothetical protein FH972_007864 [Carpinus fangiana]|uniref:Mediator of RNA polymerase II transcription subunit 18 n=1 Tax=Carpinus fangiana TaxID=176857 RepID=A0A5N6R0A0_9ROSI|nr:hypothetical protein FH972_007864 [Carpinus fangiana]